MKQPYSSVQMDNLTWCVLTCGILLCCALLTSALLTLVWAGPYTYKTVTLYALAAQLQDAAVTVLAAGLFGAILLEDMLRKGT